MSPAPRSAPAGCAGDRLLFGQSSPTGTACHTIYQQDKSLRLLFPIIIEDLSQVIPQQPPQQHYRFDPPCRRGLFFPQGNCCYCFPCMLLSCCRSGKSEYNYKTLFFLFLQIKTPAIKREFSPSCGGGGLAPAGSSTYPDHVPRNHHTVSKMPAPPHSTLH